MIEKAGEVTRRPSPSYMKGSSTADAAGNTAGGFQKILRLLKIKCAAVATPALLMVSALENRKTEEGECVAVIWVDLHDMPQLLFGLAGLPLLQEGTGEVIA